jgi:hypothetical protein
MKNKIIFREYEVTIESKNNKVVDYSGDETLISIIKPLLEMPITVMTGGHSKDKEGRITYWTGIKELKPGDKTYITAVLIERIRNQYGMEVE